MADDDLDEQSTGDGDEYTSKRSFSSVDYTSQPIYGPWLRTTAGKVTILVIGLLAVLGLNQARATSCNNNRQDRFETAFRASSQFSTLVPNVPSVALDVGIRAADREHPMIWYCFGSDR